MLGFLGQLGRVAVIGGCVEYVPCVLGWDID